MIGPQPRARIGVAPNWRHTIRDMALIALVIAIAAVGGAA